MKKGADLFCGAGGTTTGLLRACAERGHSIDLLAINHWNIAIDTHTRNHPSVRHLCESLDNVDPRKAVPDGRLDILCASPECTHHSNARGGRPCAEQSRASAWHILRWAEALRISNVLIENVREFTNWGPLTQKGRPMKRKRGRTFDAFISALRSLNYDVEHRVLNAADYGDPTTRRRLFIVATLGRKATFPKPSHAGDWQPARGVIDSSLRGGSIFARKRPLSRNTIRRIAAGLKRFGGAPFIVHLRGTEPSHIESCIRSVDEPMGTVTASGNHIALCDFLIQTCHTGGDRIYSLDRPLPTITTGHRGEMARIEAFLVKYYSTGIARPLSMPLDTLTARDRFGLVEVVGDSRIDILFRMLQPHELSAAMSFPADYSFAGNREQRVKQIGNAVPVRTAAALCAHLLA